MADAKLEMTLGRITFSAEGEADWVSAQLDKVLEKATLGVLDDTNADNPDPVDAGQPKAASAVGTLAKYLNTTEASTQVRRFLATAQWLHLKGENRITTAKVTKALTDNNQKRLSNPADCLNQNVGKGHCEKVGNEFYVTDEGRTELAAVAKVD